MYIHHFKHDKYTIRSIVCFLQLDKDIQDYIRNKEKENKNYQFTINSHGSCFSITVELKTELGVVRKNYENQHFFRMKNPESFKEYVLKIEEQEKLQQEIEDGEDE